MVCSNLGPDIALARGFWLRDQVSFLFGDCILLTSSASSTVSCNASLLKGFSIGSSFVFETFGTCFGASDTFISLFSFAEWAYARLADGLTLLESKHAALDRAVDSIV